MDDTFQQAQQMLQSGDAQGAVPLLEEFTHTNPTDWKAFLLLGIAYAKCHHYETAIGAMKQAVQINPVSAKLRYNLGQVCELANVPEEALHEYDEALRLDPDYLYARKAMAALQEKMDRERADQEEDISTF